MFRRLKKNVRQIRNNRSSSKHESSEHNAESSSGNNGSSSHRAPASLHTREDISMLTDYLVKVEELAPFDACVETSDALAASSPYTTSSAKHDEKTGLTDCSVLVSPDGELLLLPNEQDSNHSRISDDEDNKEQGGTDGGPKKEDSTGQSTKAPAQNTVELMSLGGEFESAIYVGNDLRPGGDKAMNGFSAMGWSPSASSLAIRQSEGALKSMASFVEDMMLIRKESAARASQACDKLRTRGISSLDEINGDSGDYELLANGGSVPNRVGPLFFNGGTMNAATQALEQYHSLMAENDADRWRKASLSSFAECSGTNPTVGVLPALRHAAEQAADRASKREKALREMQRRADAIDQRLSQSKEESSKRWEAVSDAEEMVTRIIEEKMIERSRERERLRMEQLRETLTEDDENTQLGATPNEIWDLVSAVAESMEGGSFEPTGLPQASISKPKDKSLDLGCNDPSDFDPESNNPDGVAPFPLASRSDIEEECQLPSLRTAAMSADDAIEDAAGSLLNVLSTLDTTRRSARIAAETCLLSAANAQAKTIRSLIALERASIEDRLRNINELERIAENIDVRADLDTYISSDKKERGGSTWFGDDDDGGVASALAVLSSHVEGSMGYTASSKVSTEGWDQGAYDEDFSAEGMEDAVDHLFDAKSLEGETEEKRASAKEEYEKSVSLLCTVASDSDSSQSRPLRSTICYAINQKRSSHAELQDPIQFDALCRVFDAILTGCDREASGVSNAKMCMMLSQTFYIRDKDRENPISSPVQDERNNRVFVKSRLMDHGVWSDEEFWDQALFQCVSESLTHSGVMANFERASRKANNSEWTENRKLKWHDLTQKERAEAAVQVHAVVFAQLGALAHSMIEFGCGIERSCAFVRRMSIRNQLPISQRAMLLQHLLESKDGGSKTNIEGAVVSTPNEEHEDDATEGGVVSEKKMEAEGVASEEAARRPDTATDDEEEAKRDGEDEAEAEGEIEED